MTLHPQSCCHGQLFEHLCLFWTSTAAEKSTSNLGMTSFSQLNPRESPLPTSPDLAFQDTPSPVPLLPNVSSAVSCRGIHRLPSNFSAEENPFSSKTQSLKSATSLTSLRHQSPAPDASSCPAEVTELFDNVNHSVNKH